MNYRFSVIIPLYNKEAEIERAICSALAQTYAPLEIIVVDDGSTDDGARIAEGTGSPLVRVVRQQNAGETAARNRGMSEAQGGYFALLDADDEWRPGFLAEIAGMIDEFPGCGIYCTGFDIVNTDGEYPARTPSGRGIIQDFFRVSMKVFIATSSSSALWAEAVKQVGGFPEGMRLGGDLYMWIKTALAYPVCFSPERLVRVHAAASNRSAAIYRPENTRFSLRDFVTPDNFWLNEYTARAALGKAIIISVRGGTEQARSDEKFFAWNRHSRRLWLRLWVLNRLPRRWRPAVNDVYAKLAWKIARKGL